MTLLELTKIVGGKYPKDAAPMKYTSITQKELDEFIDMLNINEVYKQGIETTERPSEFYNAFALFDNAVPKGEKEELFYAAKLGFFYPEVPSKLVYILRKAVDAADSPNLAIEYLNTPAITEYICRGPLNCGITVYQLLCNLFGKSFKLLTSARRRAKFNDWWEYYIPDKDRVCLIPDDIAQGLSSREDLTSICYSEKMGVCVYEQPLRTMKGHLGITKNDFDLREVV